MFKEAITDLSIAINIDKDLIDAYLNRGKCAYLIGDTSLAFMDFQKIIVLQPKNPMVHVYAGNLLMTTGSYEDATKAFTNADNIKKSPLALYQRSRCYVALTKTKEALADLNKVVELSPNDKVARNDRDCLKSLSMCSGTDVDSNAIEKSIVTLTQLINNDKNAYFLKQLHHSSIVYNHSQIIPSATRTKVDKIRTIKQIKERKAREGIQDDSEEEDFDIDIDVEDQGEIDERAFTDEANYYKENIFNKEDYYLFRAVMYFYSGDYDKARQDFKHTSDIMHANKNLNKTQNNFILTDDDDEGNGDKISNTSSQTDLSDVGLCSLNVHEFSYNLTLCLIQCKKYEEAFNKVTFMLETLPKKYTKEIWLLRGILASILGNYKIAKSDFAFAEKKDPTNYNTFINEKKEITLNIFPTAHRL